MKVKRIFSCFKGLTATAVGLFSCLLLMGGVLAPALAALPVPTHCQIDVGGVNDPPGDGQKDLTQFCVDTGNGSPYELNIKWSWDILGLSGGNTADACALFDSDTD